MKTHFSILATGLFLLFSTFSWSQTTALSFDEAMIQMKNNNPALQQTQAYIKQKEAEKGMKQGLYLPQVSVSAKAISMSDPLHLDLTPVRDAILPLYSALGNYGVFTGVPNPDPATNQIVPKLPDAVSTQAVRQQLLQGKDAVANGEWDKMIQEKSFATLSTDLIWPIYAGGKIQAANKAANIDVEIGREELRNVEGELISELTTRYYGLSLAYQVKQLREQMFDAMKHHQNDAQKLFDEGMIAKVELLSASVSMKDAERELKQASRNINIISQGLKATIASETTEELTPTSHLFINKQLPEVNSFIEQALINNAKLRQLESRGELAEINHQVGKGNYLPSAAIFGTYTLANYNQSPYTPDWIVGLGVNWKLFEGFARNNEIKKSTAMIEQVNEAREKAHTDLTTYIIKLYQEMMMQLEQIQELESTLELANEFCNSTDKSFKQGFSTSASVVDAHAKLQQVKVMRLKVYYEYDVTLAKLLQISGTPEQFLNYCTGENTIIESLN